MTAKKTPRPHLEIQTYGKKHYGVIRTTFRSKGEIRHTTHGTIKDMSLEQLKLIQAAFRGDVLVKGSADAHKVTESKEYGASSAVLQLAKDLELDKMIYSRYSEQWVKDCLAMIVLAAFRKPRIRLLGNRLWPEWGNHRHGSVVASYFYDAAGCS